MEMIGGVPAETPSPKETASSVGDSDKLPLPFVLRRMEERLGAIDPTTSGTYDNIDGADYS